MRSFTFTRRTSLEVRATDYPPVLHSRCHLRRGRYKRGTVNHSVGVPSGTDIPKRLRFWETTPQSEKKKYSKGAEYRCAATLST